MPIEITMPRLSDTMEAGTVVKWNVKAGDTVHTGDVLADIETDKATMELEAFDDGIVASLAIPEGQTVPVGSVILVLAEEGENIKDIAANASTQPPPETATSSSEPPSTTTTTTPPASVPATTNGSGRVFASPLARKIADERGLDLHTITGTGPSGRITRKDVEAVDQPPAPTVAPTATPAPAVTTPVLASDMALEHQIIPLSNMRQTIARRLIESKTTIPHYQVTVEANLDALLDLRTQLNTQLADQGVKLSVNDFLVRACALAMHQHPFINSRWIDHKGSPAIEILASVNIGVAISLPVERGGGLVVATLRDADRMGLRQISAETKRLAEKARTKGLTIDEMNDGTFTISNLGMFGVTHFTAIINPPQTAILAVGTAEPRPVVRDGQVVPGRVMAMTMSSDHRVIDGAMAAQYLATVRGFLEAPATLLV